MTPATKHIVTTHPAGYYEVTSARSGEVYRVTPWASGLWADCTCKGFRSRSRCSHIEAVRQYAEAILAQKAS